MIMNFEKIMESDFNFNEFMDLINPYLISKELEELGKAKRIIDEYTSLCPSKFTKEENKIINVMSVRLMREMDDLIQSRYGSPSFEGEDDENDPDVIYIPAGRKAGDPVRKF
jgi:hypothetical protein